jgi:nucleoside-diphosphate-sugar epimerase
MNKHVLITGASGMVGRSVLLECMDDKRIDKITLVLRNEINLQHPKINQIILKDFTRFDEVKLKLGRPDACFHCMGVSSVGLNEDEFSKLTFDISKSLADVMFDLNPEMVICYVSGTGTDSSEKGNTMWARVKGETENYFLKKGFSKAIMFRPGAIIPEKGIKSRTGWYNALYVVLKPFFPLMKMSKKITTSTLLGKAMINTLFINDIKIHLENEDINKLGLR